MVRAMACGRISVSRVLSAMWEFVCYSMYSNKPVADFTTPSLPCSVTLMLKDANDIGNKNLLYVGFHIECTGLSCQRVP